MMPPTVETPVKRPTPGTRYFPMRIMDRLNPNRVRVVPMPLVYAWAALPEEYPPPT